MSDHDIAVLILESNHTSRARHEFGNRLLTRSMPLLLGELFQAAFKRFETRHLYCIGKDCVISSIFWPAVQTTAQATPA